MERPKIFGPLACDYPFTDNDFSWPNCGDLNKVVRLDVRAKGVVSEVVGADGKVNTTKSCVKWCSYKLMIP